MKEKNIVQLAFCIWEVEDITHDELTAMIGVQPTETIQKDGLRRKRNVWILEAKNYEETDFETQMNHLLDLLEPRIEALQPLSQKYACEFSCALWLYNREESTPAVHLDTRYNEFVNRVKAEIDFDIYI